MKELFESDEMTGLGFDTNATEKIAHGIDAILLRKIIKGLYPGQLEKSQRLLKKHGFGFNTVLHYTIVLNRVIYEWNIKNATMIDTSKSDDDHALSLSYKSRDEKSEGSNLSISLQARGGFSPRERAMLTADSLKFLEELAQLF